MKKTKKKTTKKKAPGKKNTVAKKTAKPKAKKPPKVKPGGIRVPKGAETTVAVRSVKHILTTEQLADIGKSAAMKTKERTELEIKLSNHTKHVKEDIKSLQGQIDSTLEDLRRGHSIEEVECESWFNEKRKTRVFRRVDTHELVEERELTAAERQMHLKLVPPDKPDEKADDKPDDGKVVNLDDKRDLNNTPPPDAGDKSGE